MYESRSFMPPSSNAPNAFPRDFDMLQEPKRPSFYEDTPKIPSHIGDHGTPEKNIFSIPESRYSEIQNFFTKTLIDIGSYATLGFFLGTFLEYIFPSFPHQNTEKLSERDIFMMFIEIVINVVLLVLAFTFASSRGGARFGILVFILFVVATQPDLVKKIQYLSQYLVGTHTKHFGNQSRKEKTSKDDEDKKENAKKNAGKYPPVTPIDDMGSDVISQDFREPRDPHEPRQVNPVAHESYDEYDAMNSMSTSLSSLPSF